MVQILKKNVLESVIYQLILQSLISLSSTIFGLMMSLVNYVTLKPRADAAQLFFKINQTVFCTDVSVLVPFLKYMMR